MGRITIVLEKDDNTKLFMPAVDETFVQAWLYFETEFEPEIDTGAFLTEKTDGMEVDRLMVEGYIEGRGGMEIIPGKVASELEIPINRCLELLAENPLALRVTGPNKTVRFVSVAPTLDATPAGLEAESAQEQRLRNGDPLGEYWETIAERSQEVRQRRKQKFSSFFRF